MADEGEGIGVAVAYVGAETQFLREFRVPQATSVEAAIARSGVLERCPEIDLSRHKVGIFGKLARLGDRLTEGDRVEIYRPLLADPKDARRQRAAEGKAMKKGQAR